MALESATMLIFGQDAQSGNEPLLIMLELFREGSLNSHAGAFQVLSPPSTVAAALIW